jgi:hypothetical protein
VIVSREIRWDQVGGIVPGPAGANTLQIGNCTFDRNFGPRIDISLSSSRAASSANVIDGNLFRRNGYQREDEPEASAHLRLRNVKGLAVTGNSFYGDAHPKDAKEGLGTSPINGMVLASVIYGRQLVIRDPRAAN